MEDTVLQKRYQGYKKTFKTRTEAKKFMAMLEISPQSSSSKITFSQLLEQYMMEVSLKKKGAGKECLRIKAIMRRPIANVFCRT